MRKFLLGSAALLALTTSSATAADLARPVYKAPPPIWTWTGFYVGGNVGGSWGNSSNDWNIFAPNIIGSTVCTLALCATGSDSNRLAGVIGGLQAGYNWQAGSFLFGIETDIQASSQKGDQTFNSVFVGTQSSGTLSAAYTEKLPWLGTLRGRVGVTADRWLIYATGGLAYGEVSVTGSATVTSLVGVPPPFSCGLAICPLGSWSNSVTKAGWTIGAGLESLISNNWTWKVEYLHVDLGTVNTGFATVATCGGGAAGCNLYGPGTGTIRSRITDEIVRIGLNYKFGYAPVVTK
jgi:outer membrane immunogenic protein